MNDILLFLLTLFSGAAILTSVFMIFYFIFVRHENRLRNFLLASLFFAISLRIIKSVFFFIFDVSSFLTVGLGFFGLAMIGPISYLYFKQPLNDKYNFKPFALVHFIFPIIGLFVLSLSVKPPEVNFYLIGTGLLFGYIILNHLSLLSIRRKDEDKKDLNAYNVNLLLGLFFIWVTFLMQHFSQSLIGYSIGVIITTIIVYILFFYTIKTRIKVQNASTINIPSDVLEVIKVELEQKKLYLNPEINLTSFSLSTNLPTYIVSKAIKKIYCQSFPETINSLRLEEVKRRLVTDSELRIEDLAFQSGFNSLSSFYTIFKKNTAMTPGQYQSKLKPI